MRPLFDQPGRPTEIDKQNSDHTNLTSYGAALADWKRSHEVWMMMMMMIAASLMLAGAGEKLEQSNVI